MAPFRRTPVAVIADVLAGAEPSNVIGAYGGSPSDALTDARALLRTLRAEGYLIVTEVGDG